MKQTKEKYLWRDKKKLHLSGSILENFTPNLVENLSEEEG